MTTLLTRAELADDTGCRLKFSMTYSVLDTLPLFDPVSADPEPASDGAVPPFVDLVQNFSEFGQLLPLTEN